MTFLVHDGDHESYEALLALLDGGGDDALVETDVSIDQEDELLRCTRPSSMEDDPFSSAVGLIDESTSPVSSPNGDDDDALASLLLQDELIRGEVVASPLAHWPVDRVLMLAATPTQHTPPIASSSSSNNDTRLLSEATAPLVTAVRSSPHELTRSARTGTKQPKKPRSWDPNKARKEQRAELLYLREQVAQLETQLSDLQTAAAASAPTSTLSVTSPPSLSSDPPQQQQQPQHSQPSSLGALLQPPSPWKDIARHEQCARLEAEADNARMKLVLENQLSIAKSLETILRATASTEEILRVIEPRRSTTMPPSVFPERHCEILDDLLASIDTSYAEVADVFASSGLARDAGRPRLRSRVYASRCSKPSGGLQLEVASSEVLPFDVHTTAAAVWHYFTVSKQSVPYRVYGDTLPKVVETTDDTHIELFSWRLQLHGTRATFDTTQVLKRYVESDRVVIVWRGVIEAVEFAGEPVSGIRFFDRGYNVITTPSSATEVVSDCEPAPSALLQSCYIITPMFVDSPARAPPRVGAVTDFVLRATAAGLARSFRMIESVLTRGVAEQESIEYVHEPSDEEETAPASAVVVA